MSVVDQSYQHRRGLHETIPCIPSYIDPILQVLETGYCVSRRGTNSKCGFANTAKKILLTIFLFSIKRLSLKRERENQIVKCLQNSLASRILFSLWSLCNNHLDRFVRSFLTCTKYHWWHNYTDFVQSVENESTMHMQLYNYVVL